MGAHGVGRRRHRGRGGARAGRCVGPLPASRRRLVARVRRRTRPDRGRRTFVLMAFPIAPPVSPMLAKLARELPSSGGKLGDLLYEPKWDGFRAVVFRDGDELEIG